MAGDEYILSFLFGFLCCIPTGLADSCVGSLLPICNPCGMDSRVGPCYQKVIPTAF